MTVKKSELWENLSQNLFNNIDDEFISHFREADGPNSRLAAWGPFDKSARYFKFLLWNTLSHKSSDFFEAFKLLKNTDIGNPMSVRYHGVTVDIDYLLSVDEYMFLRESGIEKDISSIVEIGAGFGRTPHALLSLLPHVESYSIVDLPEVLNLSKAVLKKVVPEHFHKIKFFNALEDEWKNCNTDLVINIDSFQEMSPETIHVYLKFIKENSKYFYCKNPICKYSPESIGLDSSKIDNFDDVFKLGLCTTKIDIFDEEELIETRKEYIENYCPGSEWALSNTQPLEIFSYLQHALYTRT